MLTRSEMPVSLTPTVRLEFHQGRENFKAQTAWRNLFTVVDSNSAVERMWMAYRKSQGIKEWTAERQPEKLAEIEYTITNKDYEDTLSIDRNLIEDDQTGQIKAMAQNFGQAYEMSLDDMLITHARLGTSKICLDGQLFFDTDHAEGNSGTYSNKAGASAIASGTIQTATATFADYKLANGKNAGAKLTHVIVRQGSANHYAAMELRNSLYSTESSQMKTNVFNGLFDVIPVNYGISLNEWMALDLSKGLKPFVVTNRRGLENPNFTALEDTSEAGFWRKEWSYGIDMRMGLGYFDPRTAILFGN